MKKALLSVLTIGMLVATTPANAEVINYTGTGDTRADACSNAKRFARSLLNHNSEKIVRYGPCDCSVSGSGSYTSYTCSVDVYIEQRRD